MNISTDKESRWVLFTLNNDLYAISVDSVRELILAPAIVKLPNTPKYMRGVINLRNTTIPVIDLRLKLGMPSIEESHLEMAKMLETRKNDHIAWLDALRESARTGTEFKKALDPHMCAFGKWYDTYTTDNLTLSGLLKKFDSPHKAIHGIGAKVIELARGGHLDDAEKIIESTQHRDLKYMIDLFNSVIAEVGKVEHRVAMVSEVNGRLFGMLIDKVELVLTLDPSEISPMPEIHAEKSAGIAVAIAKPKTLKRMVIVLDPEKAVRMEEIEKLAA